MLFLILLLEGFITISVEILTIRQLLPFFGGSVLITSIIIGVFLLFLALGYWRGGSYRADVFKQLRRNFSCSLVWIGIGLSYTVVILLYSLLSLQLKFPFLLSLSCYLLLVLAPIVYWLGQTIPLTTHLFNQNLSAGRISSRALFLNTTGSFLGALLTSLLLLQYLGVAWTIVINAALLLALVTLLQLQHSFLVWKWVALCIVFGFIVVLNVSAEHGKFERTNQYANYRVVSPNISSQLLQINEASSSLLTDDKKGFAYIEFLKGILFDQYHLRHKKLLVIGAGGFTLTAAGTYDNDVTYVDIDPSIQSLVERHFLKDSIQGYFVGQDARLYLKQNRQLFDVIISDVYSHQSTIPASLLTVEYFEDIAKHLNPDGMMVANIIANRGFQDDYSKQVFNTIHAVFPYCMLVPLGFETPMSNVIYICSNTAEKKVVYRDDRNTVTTDFYKSFRSC